MADTTELGVARWYVAQGELRIERLRRMAEARTAAGRTDADIRQMLLDAERLLSIWRRTRRALERDGALDGSAATEPSSQVFVLNGAVPEPA